MKIAKTIKRRRQFFRKLWIRRRNGIMKHGIIYSESISFHRGVEK